MGSEGKASGSVTSRNQSHQQQCSEG